MAKKELTPEQLNKKVEKLEQEKADLKEANKQLLAEAEKNQKKIKSLSDELSEKDAWIELLTTRRDELNDDLTAEKERVEQLQSSLDEITEAQGKETINADEVSIKLNPNHPGIVYYRAGMQFSKEAVVFSKEKLGDKLAVLQADSNLIVE